MECALGKVGRDLGGLSWGAWALPGAVGRSLLALLPTADAKMEPKPGQEPGLKSLGHELRRPGTSRKVEEPKQTTSHSPHRPHQDRAFQKLP